MNYSEYLFIILAARKADASGNAMLPKKNKKIKDTRDKMSAPLDMSTDLHKKKVPDFQKKNEKKSWPDVGPGSA